MPFDYEAVIGLEVHAQLLTKTKAFCSCSTSFGAPPNSNVCPVCLGLPGALPVLNAEAVQMAVLAAHALGCKVHPKSLFARKNYFYPDLPKGYQISQFDQPLATDGALLVQAYDPKGTLQMERRVGIIRVHMEEDAGKNLHGFSGNSVVDLNRAGTPLIEIVGAPDLRSSDEAAEYLRQLRAILMFLGICDGNMEQGSFRCDVNVSVRPVGQEALGTRAEIKNVNSFRFVQRSIEYEIARQISVLRAGGAVEQETRGWDEKEGRTVGQRSKEEAHDYRYFPEPDLPPLMLEPAWIESKRQALPELPGDLQRRLVEELGLSRYAAGVLTSHPQIANFFQEAATLHGDPIKVANFVQSEVLGQVHTEGLSASFPVSARQIAELLLLVDSGTISGKQAKEVYLALSGTDKMPADIVEERGMRQLSDVSQLESVCRQVVEQNPKQVASYRQGKKNLLGFFVGQVMKQTQGSASPKLVNDILQKLLED